MIRRLFFSMMILMLVLPVFAQNAPLLTLITQYENIYQIAYSPDNMTLATSSFRYDENAVLFSSIQLWDAATGDLRGTLADNSTQFLSFAYSPDGSRLVTGTAGGQVVLWDTANLQIVQSVPAHDYPPEVVFAPNGQTVVTADESGIIIWNAADLAPLWILQNPAEDALLLRALVSPDSTQVAGVYAPGVIHWWDMMTGELNKTLDTGYTIEPYTAVYVPDGSALALAYHTLELWHPDENAKTAELISSAPVYDAAFTADSTRAALADNMGTLTLWDMSNFTQIATLAEGTGFVWDMAFSLDNTRLAVAQNTGIVAVYGVP